MTSYLQLQLNVVYYIQIFPRPWWLKTPRLFDSFRALQISGRVTCSSVSSLCQAPRGSVKNAMSPNWKTDPSCRLKHRYRFYRQVKRFHNNSKMSTNTDACTGLGQPKRQHGPCKHPSRSGNFSQWPLSFSVFRGSRSSVQRLITQADGWVLVNSLSN